VAAALAAGTPIERVGTALDVEELELLAVASRRWTTTTCTARWSPSTTSGT
jgi:hypothetical protein